jgi:hypothetical protein
MCLFDSPLPTSSITSRSRADNIMNTIKKRVQNVG